MTWSPFFCALLTLIVPVTWSAALERHPTYEPVLSTPQSGVAHALRGAKLTASGFWSDRRPELAIDGQIHDADAHWACEQLPATLNVDLGKEQNVGGLCVWPYWSDQRVYQYRVDGSLDGKSWTVLADHTANSVPALPTGDRFVCQARVRHLRLTVTNSSKPKNGAHIVEFAAYEQLPPAELTGGVLSINARPLHMGPLALTPASDGITMSGWRGEQVNAQVVVTAAVPLEHVTIEPLTLTSATAGAPAIMAQPRFLRYVLSEGKLQADIIDHAAQIAQPAGVNRGIWITVRIPSDAVPGQYSGAFTVRAENGAVRFPVRLEVLAQVLPPPKDWAFHLDIWQHPQAVARWHDVPLWSPEHFALLKPLMQRLADAGQKNITCNIIHEPWNAQVYDAFPSMIEWRKEADGKWTYDYRIFDRWVDFMWNDIGIRGQIVCYTMIPWHLRFRYFDVQTNTMVDQPAEPGSTDYEQLWGTFLKDFSAHLKTKGWLEKTAIGIDERPDRLLRPAMQIIKQYAPNLRVVSAVNHPSALTEDVHDLSPAIQEMHRFSPELIARRRQQGKLTTFYVCLVPRVPNNFPFSPPAESAWLPLLAAARGYDGFLRWAYNSWTENPLHTTDYVAYTSGDCFLVYPGNRSSVRWERLRDGIEEFEKIRILRARNDPRITSALDAALVPFTVERSGQSGIHAADVEQAARIVEQLSR